MSSNAPSLPELPHPVTPNVASDIRDEEASLEGDPVLAALTAYIYKVNNGG